MEEGTAHGQCLAEATVGVIEQVLGGRGEKSKQVAGKEPSRKVLLVMAQVMFEAST